MQGFYRVDPDGIFMFARWVRAPDYSLDWDERNGYVYPTAGGWRLFDNRVDAAAFFNLPADEYCMGHPEEV